MQRDQITNELDLPHRSVSPSAARRHATSPSLCAEVLCGVIVQIRLLITLTSV